VEICKRQGHAEVTHYMNNLALLYEAMGKHSKAEKLYLQTLERIRKQTGKETADYAATVHNLGRLYRGMGRYNQAEPLLVKAVDIERRLRGEEHPTYAVSLDVLAWLYETTGQYAKAEPLLAKIRDTHRRGLGEDHPTYAASLDHLASLYNAMGNQELAESYARQALETRLNVADKVLPWLPEHRALRFAERLGIGCDAWLSLLRELPVDVHPDPYPAVWRSHRLITRTISQRGRLLLDSPEAEAAYAELRLVQRQLATSWLAVPEPDQRESRRKQLSALTEKKERLESSLAGICRGFRRSLQLQHAAVDDLRGVLPADWAVIHFVRVAGVVPRSKSPGKRNSESHYEAFVLRSAENRNPLGIPWIRLASASETDEAILCWRKLIRGKTVGGDFAKSPEATLRRLLWEPIEPYLDSSNTVFVIPDGQLNFLPWPALPGRKPGTCLLEDYALAVAGSGQQLYEALTQARTTRRGLLLVGDVSYDKKPTSESRRPVQDSATSSPQQRSRGPAVGIRIDWPYLPETKTELSAIERLWNASSSITVLEGSHASEAALRRLMPQSHSVHVATHGFFADPAFRSVLGHDPSGEQLFSGNTELATAPLAQVTVRNPLLLSGLVLAGANLPPKTDKLGLPTGDDGLLTAEEIVSLDLRSTDLVVLSACDTGLGKVAGGEGVMGLTRAFHLAGARNVVASLWRVDDRATAALMRVFYEKLWRENKPPIEALREAQLSWTAPLRPL